MKFISTNKINVDAVGMQQYKFSRVYSNTQADTREGSTLSLRSERERDYN